MQITAYLARNAPFLAAGAMLTFLSSFGQTFFISLFAGHIRTDFGLSHGGWGGVYMLGTMTSALVMVWAGSLTDVFRVRVLGPVVLVGLAVACLAMAGNGALWALPVIIFALRFLGQGMSSHIAVVAMSRWFTVTRGRALAVATLGFSVAEALLPILVVLAMGFVAWQSIWIVGAVVCVVAAPVLAGLLGQERTPRALAESASSLGVKGRHWRRAEVLRHPLFWCMVPAIAGPSAFNTAFFFHQVHYAEIKDVTHLALVSLFPVYTGVAVVSMVAAGWALDRFGTAALTPFHQVPMILAFVLFAVASGPVALILGFAFLGITSGGYATLPNALWAEFFGTAHLGAIKSLAAAVMVLGSALGPGLTGWLIDIGIGLEAQFIGVAAYFAGVTVLLMWGIRRAAVDLPQR